MATCTASNHSEEKVVQQLNELFGATLNFDVIKTVAVSCEYDVQQSSNKLLEMSTYPKEVTPKKMFDVDKLNLALPQVVTKSRKTLDFEKAVAQINKGYKVVVLLRGMPGSGKSYLARKILQSTVGFDLNHRLHILSTDDFFYQHRGTYDYDVRKIDEAHNWNQRRAFQAMSRGFSPIIIDNTNTQMWEMKPYATMATDYGYIIHIVEPDTHWSFNDKELVKRNAHGVPRVKIKEMIGRYEKNITPEKLLSAYNLVYKLQKPPQLRLYPPPDINVLTLKTSTTKNGDLLKSKSERVLNTDSTDDNAKQIETINLMEFDDEIQTTKSQSVSKVHSTWSPVNHMDKLLANDNNNPATDILQPSKVSEMEITLISSDEEDELPKPSGPSNIPDIEKLWGVNAKSLLSWDMVRPLGVVYSSHHNPQPTVVKPVVKTNDSSCNTENQYFELLQSENLAHGNHGTIKVLETVNRDINRSTPKRQLGIPKIVTLDKSCMTENIYEDFENHISQLTSLFPSVPKSHLTYWYNKCKGDLEWTIEFLLEAKEEVTTLINDDIDDMKHEIEILHQPSKADSDTSDSSNEEKPTKRRSKRNQRMSTENDHLKKLIESRIDISGEHYSEKLLRVKQFKFGQPSAVDSDLSCGTQCTPPNIDQPSTSQEEKYSANQEDAIIIDSDIEFDELDIENTVDEPKVPDETLELNIGEHFVSQLESHFGDPNFPYPKGLQPVVQVPLSLARQLYTFYVESVYQQMENQNHVLETLIQEDEDFARKLQAKEQEESGAAQVVSTPNLKQIMEDQQTSQNAYKKESEKWKNLNPETLADKLTRQKLFSIFPTIDRDTLIEILYAHDNKYEDTVDTLLVSTGAENVKGSLAKIMEPPIKNEVVQEMKDAQKNNCNEEYEELQEATFYRAEANKYLKRRAELFEKAKQYDQRGMTEVAQFYSGLASLQTEYSVRANGMAATAFLDEHSKRLQDFNTLDLHFLYVKEAVPALDVFLDRNINLLRHSKTKQYEYLQIITGRGKRSENGISKIKPVVQARLKARKINYAVLNPGLLKIKITKTSLHTSEIARN